MPSSSPIILKCPDCGDIFRTQGQAGTATECERCGSLLLIPELEKGREQSGVVVAEHAPLDASAEQGAEEGSFLQEPGHPSLVRNLDEDSDNEEDEVLSDDSRALTEDQEPSSRSGAEVGLEEEVEGEVEEEVSRPSRKRRRQRGSGRRGKSLEWEKSESDREGQRSGVEDSKALPKLALGAAALLFIGVLLTLVLSTRDDPGRPADATMPMVGDGVEGLPGGLDMEAGDLGVEGIGGGAARIGRPPGEELSPRMAVAAEVLLAKAERVLEKFLGAETIDERLQYTWDPDRVRPLMESYYGGEENIAIGYREIAPQRNLSYSDTLLMTSVLLDDYSIRQVALIYDEDDNLFVDWESFSIYSEMTFDELRAQRPVEPVLLRVELGILRHQSPVGPPYWNYGFREEDNLDNYLLTEPKTNEVLYGYVQRGSAVATELRSVYADRARILVTLRVRYPEEEGADNQVWIEEVVAPRWVLLDEDR